jgi:DNA-binding MarR family transcriptional regulator
MSFKSSFNYQKTFPNNFKDKTNFVRKESWWTPLWSGLLIEPTAKHYKTMGRALWLYLYLLTYANRHSGNLFRRTSTIAGDMGLSLRTVSRWLALLKQNGYIETRQTGRSLAISITKWKPIKK